MAAQPERHHRRRPTHTSTSPTHTRLPRPFSTNQEPDQNQTPSPSNNPAEEEIEVEEEEEEDESLALEEDPEALNRTSPPSQPNSVASSTTPKTTYARQMHAHHLSISFTQSQSSPTSPTRTNPLPSYNATMHAHTLSQLNHMHNTGSHSSSARASNKLAHQHQQNLHTTTHALLAGPAPPLKAPPAVLRTQRQQSRQQAQLSSSDDAAACEAPYGPANTPEPGNAALSPPPLGPTSGSTFSSAQLLAQGRELEAKFAELMRMGGPGFELGTGCDSVGAGSTAARDFAVVGLV